MAFPQTEQEDFIAAIGTSNRPADTRAEAIESGTEILDFDDIVMTHETVSDFCEVRGPSRIEKTEFGPLHVWERVQTSRGKTRGTLFVMDFGHARACYFTGQA